MELEMLWDVAEGGKGCCNKNLINMIFSPYLLPCVLFNPTTLLIAAISLRIQIIEVTSSQLLSLIIQVSWESHSLSFVFLRFLGTRNYDT
jgi:hypothetical protein